MKKPGRPIKWDYNKCLQSAQKFSTVSSWTTQDTNAYVAACRYGWRDQIIEAARLKRKKNPIFKNQSFEGCLEQASGYSSLSEWARKHHSSYSVAGKLKIRKTIALRLGWKKAKSLQTEKDLKVTGMNPE